jgi:hypothetical protein
MPLKIEPKQVTPRRKITVSLKTTVADGVERYCEYLGGHTDKAYVVDEILEAYFNQDKDFQRWLEGRRAGTGPVSPT